MPRKTGFNFDTEPIAKKEIIESNWEPMILALQRKQWFEAQDIARGLPNGTKQAIYNRMIIWLNNYLAIPATKEFNWIDDQGLNRMIYMVWPEIPVKILSFDMLPDMMLHLDRYNNLYRTAQIPT